MPARAFRRATTAVTGDVRVDRGHPGRRAPWLLVRLAGGLLAGAAVLGACGGGPASTSGTPTASAARPAVHQAVTIQNFAFEPANFTVRPGATITVTNRDSVTHTFTADNGAFNTGNIAPGRTRTVTAPEKPGTYPYRCLIHQFMTGTVTVR